MPRLSEFYGIVIAMYFDDHPPPHFHAIYGEHQAQVAIATLGHRRWEPAHPGHAPGAGVGRVARG